MLELINYLQKNYLTEQQLLSKANLSKACLVDYQQRNMMPQASYTLRLQLNCTSFLANREDAGVLHFYPQSSVDWLNGLHDEGSESDLFEKFKSSYLNTLTELNKQGFVDYKKALTSEEHLETEWQYYLEGVYGLCTRNGTIAEIAKKELAIAIIEYLTELHKASISGEAAEELRAAVDLLDNASSAFAPHERSNCSRERLVNQVRLSYFNLNSD